MDTTLRTKLENNYDMALNAFNFSTVQCEMVRDDWKWAMGYGMRTPTIEEMIDVVRKCFEDAMAHLPDGQSQRETVSCGGFEVEIDGRGIVEIRFGELQTVIAGLMTASPLER
jgi:hypothetical protein